MEIANTVTRRTKASNFQQTSMTPWTSILEGVLVATLTLKVNMEDCSSRGMVDTHINVKYVL
jgi:hypothetical protein